MGISGEVRLQRSILFGPNIIDVQGKSTFTLLIEEVRLMFTYQSPFG